MNHNGIQLAEKILSKARKKGATAGDVVLVEGETSTVQIRMGTVDKLSSAREKRLGLRLFYGRKTAVSSTADLSMGSLDNLLDTTCALAQATSEDPHGGLPENPELDPTQSSQQDLNLWDPGLMECPMEARIDMAKKAETAAFNEDPRITNSEGSDLTLSSRQVSYVNSNGFKGSYPSSSISLVVMPIANSNGRMQRDYWFCAKRKLDQLESPESIGKEAARRTIRRLDARGAKTTSCPVVFDPQTAGELIGSLTGAVSGYSIYKGVSFLAGKLGKLIASPQITVIDDGTLPSGLASRPFDGEGLRTRKTVVIENGILRTYLLDSYSARKLNLSSTGNAARSVGDFPTVSPTNFYLVPGKHPPEEIIGSVKNGLYVTEMIGFGVNMVTGDYSRGASGIWIENGKLTYPVEGVTIAGNLKEMLGQITMIGNDLDFRGSITSPTLLISQMMLAGE